MNESFYARQPQPEGSTLARWVRRLVLVAITAVVTVVVGGGFDARRRHPELEPWHRMVPAAELHAADLQAGATLGDYLRREGEVFDEMRRDIEDVLPADERVAANRYNPAGPCSPRRLPHDYNRTFEIAPASPRGGVLLVHGLSDSPYSMRAIAERLGAAGYYALALRMPGHGAVPGGLTQATWQDWMAAVRLGARHVQARAGADRPFVLVGYSNGGALAVKYALDVASGEPGPMPARLVLLSPMIGVTPLARLASVISALSPIPYFDRAAWLDVFPEYNPFKFNSFPANAGRQTYDLTRALAAEIEARRLDGRIDRLPPILTFQSLVDATVSTEAVVKTLYAALPRNGSELVIYDLNRAAGLEPFLRPADRALFETLFDRRTERDYDLTIVSNASRSTLEVAAYQVPAGSVTPNPIRLGMSWPQDVFSLSHVAIPFPADDPVYGAAVARVPNGPIRLGLLSPRGERSVLTVPVDTLMRATYNPFFPDMAERIVGWVNGARTSRAQLPAQ